MSAGRVYHYNKLVVLLVCEFPLRRDRHWALCWLAGHADHGVSTRGHTLVNPVQFAGVAEAVDLTL